MERDNEWWAVAKDVAVALGYDHPENAIAQHCRDAIKHRIGVENVAPRIRESHSKARKTQNMIIIPEKDLYRLIFHSHLPEAEAFQEWIFDIIKELRKSLGLSGYEAFCLMDKAHQKEAMHKLSESLREPVKVDYIKANIIADKTVSIMHGYSKLIKKPDMDEGMLRDRELVLADTVELMALNARFHLGLSISEQVYQKYGPPAQGKTA
jgi:prophage antirepressor-like protein